MVSPGQIDIRKHFFDAFSNHETEISARYIVEFCQLRCQEWAPFTYEQINEFYKSKGHHDGFWFNLLPKQGHIVDTDGQYQIQPSFVDCCFQASLVVEINPPHSRIIKSCDHCVGFVSQSPDSTLVENPGKWHAQIFSLDGYLAGLGVFDTQKEAQDAALDGLVKNWTYDQWLAHWEEADSIQA